MTFDAVAELHACDRHQELLIEMSIMLQPEARAANDAIRRGGAKETDQRRPRDDVQRRMCVQVGLQHVKAALMASMVMKVCHHLSVAV